MNDLRGAAYFGIIYNINKKKYCIVEGNITWLTKFQDLKDEVCANNPYFIQNGVFSSISTIY